MHLAQTDTDSTHPTTQSDPDLQTAQPQARNSRTITDCRGYQSSRAVCRLGRSGSSGFVGRFRPWNWCGCVPVSRVRRCRDWCRYRYTCRLNFSPVTDGYRPK